MATDIAGLNAREPEQVNWDNYNPGSKFTPPPPVAGPDGKPITYYGEVAGEVQVETDDEGYLRWVLDPVKIVRSGNGSDGYQLRFTRVSTKKFQKNGKTVEASSVGNFLKACQVQQKPQKNADYHAAVLAAVKGKKIFPFTIEWEARNKETGEQVKGFANFPMDPERPGHRKAILKRGDVLADGTTIVQSEVLFANARLRYFQDPTRNKK